MSTIYLSKKPALAQPFQTAGALKLGLYILMLIGLIAVCQKVESDKQTLRTQIEDSYKTVAARDTEKAALRAEIRDMKAEVARISQRYNATLQKSFSVIAENKAEIKALKNRVEVLVLERDILRKEAAGKAGLQEEPFII